MATEYYVDGPGNYLGAWPSGHSDIPGGATEVGSAPPINDTQIWGFPNWGAIVPATVSMAYDHKTSKNSGTISEFNVFGWNSALTENAYSKISTIIVDNTAGSEDGSLKFETCQNGALVEVLTLEKGIVLNGATGGDQGLGSINSTAYHINGGTAIESGATANDTDANLKARANHTGTQTMSTISDAGSVATLNEIAEGNLSAAVQTKLNNTAPSKFDAVAAPTANDDAADTSGNGTFAVGSIWIDTTNDEAYRCVDDTATAAIWINTTLTTGELGTIATQNANAVNITGGTITGITNLAVADGGTGAGDAATARTNLGLVIGTDVLAYSAVLDATTASFLTADETKLDGIESGATADQTGAEIKTAYEAEADAYTDTKDTKLGGIEALADVTDTANVTTAGALMDSEVDADLKTLVLPADTTISVFGASLVDDADASAGRDTLGLVINTDVQAFDANTSKLNVAQEWTKTQNFNATSLVALGSDLVTNGEFAADTDWTKGTGWTIAAGVASSDGTQGGDADLTQALSLVNGKTYEVEFTVSNYSAGNVTPVAGDTEGTDRAANGTFTENIIAGAGGDIDIRADLDFVGDIDDVTVRLANVSWDLESNQVTKITLDGDLVIDTPTNLVDGATYILTLTQDAVGTRLATWGSVFKWPGGTVPTLSTGVNDVDIITFVSDGTSMFGVFQGDFS